MKKIPVALVFAVFLFGGCDSLRFAPSEKQKQNAWLHNRTTAITADTARMENSSEKLQALTKLSELQSKVFVSYHGLPKEPPPAQTAEDILAESNLQLVQAATSESDQRPDVFEVADNIFELVIGASALLGGIYGTRAVNFLRQARKKSKALQEIIEGNELFKKQNKAYANAFKEAQKSQSAQTRQLVAQIKA